MCRFLITLSDSAQHFSASKKHHSNFHCSPSVRPISRFTTEPRKDAARTDRDAISSTKLLACVPIPPRPRSNNNISISRSFVFDDCRACTPFQLTYDLCRIRTRIRAPFKRYGRNARGIGPLSNSISRLRDTKRREKNLLWPWRPTKGRSLLF